MTIDNLNHILENTDKALDLSIGITDPVVQRMRRLLLKIRVDTKLAIEHAESIDHYDTYIESLQSDIQHTAPWLFNQYIDPEDLLDDDR